LSLLPAVVARLGQLRSGDVATVTGLDSTRLAAKRLADMGFIPGVKVEMLRSGTPCLVRVNGICLGLGAGHQESILLSALASG
jgi:Fe2+ transport system protein FeoA